MKTCAVCKAEIPKESRRRKYCSKKCYETTVTGGMIVLLELGPLDTRPRTAEEKREEKAALERSMTPFPVRTPDNG